MAIIRRQNELKKLDELDFLIEDTSSTSPFYFNIYDIPDIFSAGKTAFLINGSDNLVLGTEVDVEVRDSEGNVIYSEYPRYLEGISRLVSVWVFPETSYGEATITVIGEARRQIVSRDSSAGMFGTQRQSVGFSTREIPTEWKGVFNVRWQKIITINPERKNNSQIRFYKQPRIFASEIFQPYLERTLNSVSYDFMSGSVQGVNSNRTPSYYLISDMATGSGSLEFSSEMSGARLIVPQPNVFGGIMQYNQFPPDLNFINLPQYETTIKKVLNKFIAIAEPPYRITSSLSTQKNVTKLSKTTGEVGDESVYNFNYSPFTMSIDTPPTYSLTENFRSYARLRITDMGTFSGDINALNISMKSVGTVGDFEPVVVHNIETTEQFTVPSTQSITLNERVGLFNSQSTIDNYWSQSGVASMNALPTGALFFTESRMTNAMLFSGSDETRQFWIGDHYRLESLVSMSFYKDSEYTFRSNFHAIRKPALKIVRKNVGSLGKFPYPQIVNDARIEVYISGSAFDTPTTKNFGGKISTQQSSFGKIIGLIDLDDVNRGQQDDGQFRDFRSNFIANQDGSGSIVFVIRSGDWHFSDISVRQGYDDGFAPDYVDLVVPYPDFQRNDDVVFKCEFINAIGNRAELFATSSETFFTGGNVYIQGNDNLVTGSIFVGNFLGSGFELSGRNSAFIRSVSYRGWENANIGSGSGLMLWSGSVLPESTSLDPYNGVGIEIHGGLNAAPDSQTNALRFRTDTGRLEITGSIESKGVQFTENIVYRRINITSANRTDYFSNVSGTASQPTFSVLDLSSQNDLVSGIFVRIETSGIPDFPIGFIHYPTFAGSTGFFAILESAAVNDAVKFGDTTDYATNIATNHPEFNNLVNRRIGQDGADWTNPSWISESIAPGSGSYTTFNLKQGGRYFIVNNDLDYKIQNANRYDGFLVFDDFWVGSNAVSPPHDDRPKLQFKDIDSTISSTMSSSVYMDWEANFSESVLAASLGISASLFPQASNRFRITPLKGSGSGDSGGASSDDTWLIFGGYDEKVVMAMNFSSNSIHFGSDIQVPGTASVGRIEKSGGSFVIPHPDSAKSGTLWHSFVESPTAGDNIYRWRIETTSSGEIIFELPDYWKHLNENPQVWISPYRMLARGSGWVDDGLTKLHMLCDHAGEYEILLIGTRKDEHARGWLGVERDD